MSECTYCPGWRIAWRCVHSVYSKTISTELVLRSTSTVQVHTVSAGAAAFLLPNCVRNPGTAHLAQLVDCWRLLVAALRILS